MADGAEPRAGRTDFLAREASLQRATRRMLVLFGLTVASVVAVPVLTIVLVKYAVVRGMDLNLIDGLSPWPQASTLWWVGGGVAVLIGMFVWSRVGELRAGGSDVMESYAAVAVDPATTDPAQRRLRDVVEEMAIAAAIPVPDLFMWNNEPGINAFCAGHGAADAAICVTHGCLDHLNRDELQAVVAREVGRIVHGDMQLNIRLLGLVSGVYSLSTLGRRLMRGGTAFRGAVTLGDPYDTTGSVGVLLLAAGAVLWLVGLPGDIAGHLLQAAVARSRQYLADAAALQFTRQNTGLTGALEKTAALYGGSFLQCVDSSEIGHMLFADGRQTWRLLAAHPTIPQRLHALGVRVDPYRVGRTADALRVAAGAAAPDVESTPHTAAAPMAAVDVDTARRNAFEQMGWAVAADDAPSPAPEPSRAPAFAPAAPAIAVPTPVAADAPPRPGFAVPARAADSLNAVPNLCAAAKSVEDAPALVLMLGLTNELLGQQLDMIQAHMGQAMRARVQALLVANGTTAVPVAARLPLVSMAFPCMRRLLPGQRSELADTLRDLAAADGTMDLHEFCMLQLVRTWMRDLASPAQARNAGTARLEDCRADYALLCAIVVTEGGTDAAIAQSAWQRVMDAAIPGHGQAYKVPTIWQTTLGNALWRLDSLCAEDKQRAVTGIADLVRADGEVTVVEAELIQVMCACLHCPVPALEPAGAEAVAA